MKQSDAIKIIVEAFKGKTDRGGDQYVNHLFRVATTVSNLGKEDLVIPALLHDLLEDCPEWTEQRLLLEGLDSRHLDVIKILTHNPEDSYEEYIEKISKDIRAIEIKLADLRDNMDITRLSSLSSKDLERLQKYNKSYNYLISKLNA
jgi:(p)ppGpp synthase/HD superfamily hydrolase